MRRRWVASSGCLPERVDAFELRCEEVGDDGGGDDDSRGLRKLRRGWGALCSAQCLQPLRQRAVTLVYVLLCAAALLHWALSDDDEGGGGGGDAGQRARSSSFVFVDDADQ